MALGLQPQREAFWAEHLDAGQQAALQEFRQILQSQDLLAASHRDDVTLCRFLKARKWEPEKAVPMYRDMIAWRASYLTPPNPPFHTDEIRTVKVNHPHFYHKTDKYGRPVYYELLGDLNLAEVLKACDIQRLIRLHCLGWEKVRSHIFPACSVAADRDIYTCVTVLDLKGLKMTSFNKDTREFIAAIANIDQWLRCAPKQIQMRPEASNAHDMQNYFPEHLGQMFIVNAPFIFRAMWAVISPWLEPRTQVKIQVISSEKSSRQTLLAAIPAENLIKRLGGLSEVDILADEGPWSDEGVRDKVSRSQYQHQSSASTLAGSTVSADTAVEMAA